MKTSKLFILALIGAILTSCTYKIYPTQDMAFNYNMRMNTQEELEAKAKVKIFLNEEDVKGDYQVIAYLSYKPFTIPVIMNKRNKTIRKFYEKAVMKANELGGNGIIVMGGGVIVGGVCKVINITNWDADAEQSASFVNVIFDRTMLDKFNSGAVASENKSAQKRDENTFKAEIKYNLRYAKTLDEISIIKEKIDAYEKYNQSLEKPKSYLTKDVKKLRALFVGAEKKVNILVKREAKKAAKASAKNVNLK